MTPLEVLAVLVGFVFVLWVSLARQRGLEARLARLEQQLQLLAQGEALPDAAPFATRGAIPTAAAAITHAATATPQVSAGKSVPPGTFSSPIYLPGGPFPPPSERVVSLIRQNKKIQAIKEYRDNTGLGLKDSKDVIEYVEANGSLPLQR